MNLNPIHTKKFDLVEGSPIGGGSPPVLFAGPCVIEGANFQEQLQMVRIHAQAIADLARRVNIPFVFKTSYDKANRTSIKSWRGPGVQQGLEILSEVRRELKIPILTDAHSVAEIELVAEVVDVIQIPAFLCRQTDLIVAAAETGKVVNVKKGQFLAPGDVKHIIGKFLEAGGQHLILTERGTFFGYNQLVVDFIGLVKMRELGWPVVFDATHSVQSPGGLDGKTGGESAYAPLLALAAGAVGVDGLFIETHQDPTTALSDAANMIPLGELEQVLLNFKAVSELRQRELD